ncbi:hypothetical protein BV898_19328 [Hypsibius exemplaris]|uniref:Uncharacterized protein n=1 Tax=Hypsibius exemplaris TaxID=2072580 RepID=A0A9X6NQI5_HYPEX|nr:hypothetical protein BV898_19328 [Hypsibius exemplaris]
MSTSREQCTLIVFGDGNYVSLSLSAARHLQRLNEPKYRGPFHNLASARTTSLVGHAGTTISLTTLQEPENLLIPLWLEGRSRFHKQDTRSNKRLTAARRYRIRVLMNTSIPVKAASSHLHPLRNAVVDKLLCWRTMPAANNLTRKYASRAFLCRRLDQASRTRVLLVSYPQALPIDAS